MNRRKFLGALFLLIAAVLAPRAFADVTPTLRPTADGTNDSASWTNTAGTACNAADCSLEVKESSGNFCTNSDGNATLIESNTTGAQQTFNLDISSIPANSTITRVDITGCARKQSAAQADNTFQTRRCVNATCVSSGTNLTAGATYAESTQSHAGLSITKTSSTKIEIGAEVTGSVTNNVRLSQISAVITYTLPPPPPPPPPAPSPAPTPPPATGGTSASAPSNAYFYGQAYPESKIDVLRRSNVVGAYESVPLTLTSVKDDGTFQVTIQNFLQAEYFFAIRATDKDGRQSRILPLISQFVSSGNNLVLKDIFVPPTIDVIPGAIPQGQPLKVLGYAAPSSTVEVSIDETMPYQTTPDASGFYTFTTSTTSFSLDNHTVKARFVLPSGAKMDSTSSPRSDFSIQRVFKVSPLAFPKADLNGDNVVDISDWSIFLFRWGSTDAVLKKSIDFNNDGKVDISDLSIFLQSMRTK